MAGLGRGSSSDVCMPNPSRSLGRKKCRINSIKKNRKCTFSQKHTSLITKIQVYMLLFVAVGSSDVRHVGNNRPACIGRVLRLVSENQLILAVI